MECYDIDVLRILSQLTDVKSIIYQWVIDGLCHIEGQINTFIKAQLDLISIDLKSNKFVQNNKQKWEKNAHIAKVKTLLLFLVIKDPKFDSI